MAKAGIGIDPWKREIFERHLNEAGYTFKNLGLITEGVMVLHVEADDLHRLQHVLERANVEAVISNN